MALFRGIQEYIALNANNITLIFDSGNIFLYPPQDHPILYKYFTILDKVVRNITTSLVKKFLLSINSWFILSSSSSDKMAADWPQLLRDMNFDTTLQIFFCQRKMPLNAVTQSYIDTNSIYI